MKQFLCRTNSRTNNPNQNKLGHYRKSKLINKGFKEVFSVYKTKWTILSKAGHQSITSTRTTYRKNHVSFTKQLKCIWTPLKSFEPHQTLAFTYISQSFLYPFPVVPVTLLIATDTPRPFVLCFYGVTSRSISNPQSALENCVHLLKKFTYHIQLKCVQHLEKKV